MIVVVNYGLSNVQSVFSKIFRMNSQTILGQNSQEILKATKLILPGVGNFAEGMKNLAKLDLVGPLTEMVLERKIPILGICLGMQFFTEFSEEGDCPGLGWVKANTTKFRFEDRRFPVPHVGWETLNVCQQNPFYQGISDRSRFYFTHSYFVKCQNIEDVGCTTEYGGQQFVSSIRSQNIFGCQFHPEKSHMTGKHLIENFLEL